MKKKRNFSLFDGTSETLALAGEFVKQQKEIEADGLKVKRANNSTAGDIDVATLRDGKS